MLSTSICNFRDVRKRDTSCRFVTSNGPNKNITRKERIFCWHEVEEVRLSLFQRYRVVLKLELTIAKRKGNKN